MEIISSFLWRGIIIIIFIWVCVCVLCQFLQERRCFCNTTSCHDSGVFQLYHRLSIMPHDSCPYRVQVQVQSTIHTPYSTLLLIPPPSPQSPSTPRHLNHLLKTHLHPEHPSIRCPSSPANSIHQPPTHQLLPRLARNLSSPHPPRRRTRPGHRRGGLGRGQQPHVLGIGGRERKRQGSDCSRRGGGIVVRVVDGSEAGGC